MGDSFAHLSIRCRKVRRVVGSIPTRTNTVMVARMDAAQITSAMIAVTPGEKNCRNDERASGADRKEERWVNVQSVGAIELAGLFTYPVRAG